MQAGRLSGGAAHGGEREERVGELAVHMCMHACMLGWAGLGWARWVCRTRVLSPSAHLHAALVHPGGQAGSGPVPRRGDETVLNDRTQAVNAGTTAQWVAPGRLQAFLMRVRGDGRADVRNWRGGAGRRSYGTL